jgi:hypothetical protein
LPSNINQESRGTVYLSACKPDIRRIRTTDKQLGGNAQLASRECDDETIRCAVFVVLLLCSWTSVHDFEQYQIQMLFGDCTPRSNYHG